MRCRVSCCVGVLLLALAASATAQTPVRRGHALDATGMIRIWNLAGAIRVVGWERDSVDVAGTLGAGARLTSGGTRAAVKLAVEGDAPAGGSAEARLEIRVPARAQVWVKSTTADVTIEGVDGSVEVYSVTGALRLTGAPRDVVAESMGGPVIADVRAGRLRIRTASGSIRFGGSADDVDVTSVSGAIVADWPALRRARLESVEGDIAFNGPVASGAALSVINHSGDIDVRVPPGTAAEFSVSTYEGPVENRLAPRAAITPVGLNGRQLAFTLGEYDGTRVEIRSFKGAIRLLPLVAPAP